MNQKSGLPLKNDLKLIYLLSGLIAVLLAAASLGGLLFPDQLYPSDELLQNFLPNDVVSLLIGLPILVGAMLLARRGSLLGLLVWPGALFFVLYNYLVYIFGMPLNLALLLHLFLVMLSAYTLVGLLASMDGEAVRRRLEGSIPNRAAGGILAGLGLLFTLRALGVLAGALASGTALPETELALNASDFLTSPAWVIGGILLWRREALGYVFGLGLLFQASALFLALIIFLLIQPALTGATLALADVIVVAVMGLVCFVPFGLFLRGVTRQGVA